MKICVIGAGVVGLSAAYALARLGHEITVIDKNSDVAGGASHANGAQLSFSYVDPFAGRASLKALPKYLLGQDPAIRLRASFRAAYLRWGLGFLRNCSAAKETENLKLRAALSVKSARAFDDIMDSLPPGGLKKTSKGKLVLLPDDAAYRSVAETRSRYTDLGLERDVLTREFSLEKEPALHSFSGQFTGAVYSKSDFALDPLLYCRVLKTQLAQMGAVFYFGCDVSEFVISGDRVAGLKTRQASIMFDKIVLCTGNAANDLLAPLGLRVPIYPMQGYSLTLPSTDQSPRMSITSLKDKIVYANLGRSIRVAGFMDANQSQKTSKKRQQDLFAKARTLWPDIADYEGDVSYWTGQRPMTPSGVPFIGESRLQGLYLNVGHGSLGFTFAAGSAKILAEKIGALHNDNIPYKGGHRHAVS